MVDVLASKPVDELRHEFGHAAVVRGLVHPADDDGPASVLTALVIVETVEDRRVQPSEEFLGPFEVRAEGSPVRDVEGTVVVAYVADIGNSPLNGPTC